MLAENGVLDIRTPRWAVPHLAPCRLKGAKGGRSSGKSHFKAERLVEHHIADPEHSSVCIREVQRSLRYSAFRLIKSKIRDMGVGHLFDIQRNEIHSRNGDGVIIFQGMQDHTAESIKSLEGFNLAWIEEASGISQRSLDLLLPTIRSPGSEIWASWNPQQEDDPIEKLMREEAKTGGAVVTHCTFMDNPFCPQVSIDDARKWQIRDPDSYPHVWLGEHNTKSDDQVLAGRWRVDEFDPQPKWHGPYFGGDWGFSTDPSTVIECYVGGNTLYVYAELYEHGVETDNLPAFYDRNPRTKTHTVRADNARPENISYMQRHGYAKVESCKKWPGSVEDGVSKLRSFDEIVIHVGCPHTIEEARLWKYKRDRLTQDVLPVLIDKHNHCWDAIRYGIGPLIKQTAQAAAW